MVHRKIKRVITLPMLPEKNNYSFKYVVANILATFWVVQVAC